MSAQTQAIEQAIDFLTTPLSRTTVSASAISVLQAHLFASLNSLSTRSPNRTIGLRLASSTQPPECISRACEASGVNWGEWMFLIGGGMGLDLDISIQPTAVTASFSRAGTPSLGLVTVWQQQEEERPMSTRDLLYADDDSEDLFNEIHRSQNSPSWLSTWGVPSKQAYKASALSQPMSVPKLGPVPTARSSHSNHSRSSSYASTTSSHSHHSQHSHHSASYHPNQANVNPEFGYPHAMERPGSSNSSNASGSPRGSVYSLSEDGSSGSSGLSWTRRGTVVPGPQQSAIMAARQAHAHAQAQALPQMKGIHPAYIPAGPVTEVQLPAFGLKHHHQSQPSQSSQQSRHKTSPSNSTCSVGSTASGHSGGSANGSKHRRQRSQTASVVVDPAKASVTAYDGGKTKVMTGGVMLGSITGGSKKKGL